MGEAIVPPLRVTGLRLFFASWPVQGPENAKWRLAIQALFLNIIRTDVENAYDNKQYPTALSL